MRDGGCSPGALIGFLRTIGRPAHGVVGAASGQARDSGVTWWRPAAAEIGHRPTAIDMKLESAVKAPASWQRLRQVAQETGKANLDAPGPIARSAQGGLQ